MPAPPRVSIVTPAIGGAGPMARTVESVLAQLGVEVEHLVVHAGAPGEALAAYAHLRHVGGPASGRAGAVGAGLRAATGEVLGVLDPGEALLPGALLRAAREIDPRRGRHVVAGRCGLLDAHGRRVGIEHPTAPPTRRLLLEIWKGPAVSPPAVFWTPEAWRHAGAMDESGHPAWSRYDLLCRLSRTGGLHFVDDTLALRPVDPEWVTGAARLDDGIAISRRHWGSPLGVTYWRLALSLCRFRFDRAGRGRRHLARARARLARGSAARAMGDAVAAVLLAPEVAFSVGLYPTLQDRTIRMWRRVMERAQGWGALPLETAVYLERTEAWSDGWVGPRLAVSRETDALVGAVDVRGWVALQHVVKPLVLTVRVDGRLVGRHRVREAGDFLARLPLPEPLPPGPHTVDVEASTWFVPDRLTGSGDLRPLAWRFGGVELHAVTDR